MVSNETISLIKLIKLIGSVSFSISKKGTKLLDKLIMVTIS